MSDLLEACTRALRDAGTEEAAADQTLERIERSLRKGRGPSRARAPRWIVWPLAATFLVFTAWASASGQIARWVSRVTLTEPEHPRSHEPEVAPAAASGWGLPPRTPVATVSTAADAGTEDTGAPSEAASSVTSPSTSASSRAAVAARPVAAALDVDALYRDAHEAHFTRRDPQAALAAWDRYLAAAGSNGRFVLEARYNRALSLVRLGRKDEARRALEPFANGDYGGYRRDEATKLMSSLE